MTRAPGGGLLHPAALMSIAVLVVNDHVLKPHWAHWLPGKLSDVAGLVFFPLLLQGLWELVARASPQRRALLVASGLTAVAFALVKTWPPATAAWSTALGALQWPFLAVRDWWSGAPLPDVRAVHAVTDPTDLLALPAIGVALRLGWKRSAPVE